MRKIPLSKKSSVRDIKVGSIFPTNLIAYDLTLYVDDNKELSTIFEINLEKNSRSIGFQDDFADFVTYAKNLEYITLEGGNNAKFLREWYTKFELSNCRLHIIYSKKADELKYVGKIDVDNDAIHFHRKDSK